MTNEQLALLLKLIADRLVRELNALDELLPEGLEREKQWWFGSERAADAHFAVQARPLLLDDETLMEEGYELRPTGIHVLLEGLYEFADELAEWESTLNLKGKE